MVKIQSVIGRVFAVFGSSALAALAGGALINVELWKAACLAGFMAAAKVTEQLLKFWAEDGVLSREEVAIAFGGKKPDAATGE